MAEATFLRNNALPYPIYGAPWTLCLPILDADGDLVTGATGLDSEISKNGDTPADCTNEATEIGSSGKYYLSLTGTELTADVVDGVVKTSTSGAKTTPFTLYPRKLVTIRSGTAASAGSLTSTIVLDSGASDQDDFYNGMIVIATIDSNVEVRLISDYTGSTKSATVVPDWNVAPDSDDTFIIKLPEGWQLHQANLTQILGAAVSTSAAQLGVNVVQAAGTAWNSGAILASTIADAAIDRATFAVDTGLQTIRSNTAQAGAAGTVTLDASASATTDFYVGLWVFLTGGTGVGQVRVITAYNGTTKVATIAPNWATNPDNTSTFALLHAAQLTGIQGSVTGSVGSVTGAVGSVTGAVGSVTGNVGGNVTGSVGSVASGGITNASLAADTGLKPIRTSTAQAGAATTITLDAGASAVDDLYNYELIVILSGTGAGQARFISDYVGSTKVATVPTWQTNPDNTSVFAILPFGAIPGATAPTAADVADAVWDEARSGHVSAGSFGEGVKVESLNTQAKADVNTEADTAASDYGALKPTTAGRTLDVTATGEAGIDWANIGGPTTTQNLSGTTVKTATDVETDTQDIQGRLPAALVSGRMSSDAVAISGSTATADAVEANIGNLDAAVSTRASQTSVDTIDDFLDTEIAAIKAVTDLFTAAQAEPSAVPAANATPLEKIAWLATLARNKITQTATTQTVRNNADSGTIGTSTVSDDGTTFTRGKFS